MGAAEEVEMKRGLHMEWMQFVTVLLTVLGSSGFLWKEMKAIENKIEVGLNRADARTDKLYEMFIALLDKK
jgi:hypothetical protein